MKQVILVRVDLKMKGGKLASQCAHGSVEAAVMSDRDTLERWRKEGMKKVILKVSDLNELKDYQKKANNAKLKTALITDAGRTFFKTPTITCLAIGPDEESKVDKVTGKLKML
ncbi:MAG TPA: peptidyl-tRNA hydrolase Pth2 [Candidatus Nanoarchaeia archaeon]|nr:peptidyl-tRNA hydrolase Pth2 [Candidatus Nanoarchaeia archaeon]